MADSEQISTLIAILHSICQIQFRLSFALDRRRGPGPEATRAGSGGWCSSNAQAHRGLAHVRTEAVRLWGPFVWWPIKAGTIHFRPSWLLDGERRPS